ncbi:MAG: flavodoxin domain-containing protein [Actinobacteria bacterium]|nr:flavodoxin domain-containing protein [Actinomycetota bacterium]
MKALIVYHTKTGHTKAAADDIARGLGEKGVEVTVEDAANADPAKVGEFDMLLVGSPTYGNTLYRSAAKPVEKFMDSMKPDTLSGHIAGAFSINGAMGAEKVVAAMEKKLSSFGAKVVSPGPAVKAGAPLSLWKGPDAGPEDVAKCEEFGRRLAGTA